MKKSMRIFLVVILVYSLLLGGCNQKGQGNGITGQGVKSKVNTQVAENNVNEISVPEKSSESIITNVEKSEDYGSKGALAKTEFTLEEMITYAIQDEYAAKAEYEKIMIVFNVTKPFSNIVESEKTHIALLKPLFLDNNISIPLDISGNYVVLPENITAAYQIGIDAEIANIAMYEKFLEQKNLSDSVRDVFIKLRDGSKNHLEAFKNNK